MNWGIMGTGGIAAALADAIVAEGDRVMAVSSGTPGRAEAFAAARDVPSAYPHHHGLLDDPDVEVVYVATTNERHHLDVQACVDAGRPVLAEKPFALELAQAEAVLASAQAAGVFVMEAMWMRVQPAFLELQLRIANGEIGEPRVVQADFGIEAVADPARRWFDPRQGGGALLDVGIYPLTLATAVLGPPTQVTAVGELADTGVDAQVAVGMRHAVGVSSCVASFVADTGIEATIAGPDGSLRLHGPFHSAPRLTLRRGSEGAEHVEVVGHDLGYRHEVREVHRCLEAGWVESPLVPHAATLEVMAVLDEVRRQVGVVYP